MSDHQSGEIGTALRERIARALWASDFCGDWDADPHRFRANYLRNADDVLHALGLKHVAWLGPYGIVPGGLDVEPHANWQPLYMLDPSDISGSTEGASDGR